MKVLMIHEVHEWMLDLDLSEYDLLTFDDGLYSQYFYYKEFLKHNIPMIFFISTNIISNNTQNLDFPSCSVAHQRFFESSDTSNYMNWNQILELHNTPNCKIGGHSHQHIKYKDVKIKKLYDLLLEDCNEMMNIFKHYNIEITDYCYPYNIKVPLRDGILKNLKIENFYGKERIAIETLKGKK